MNYTRTFLDHSFVQDEIIQLEKKYFHHELNVLELSMVISNLVCIILFILAPIGPRGYSGLFTEPSYLGGFLASASLMHFFRAIRFLKRNQF